MKQVSMIMLVWCLFELAHAINLNDSHLIASFLALVILSTYQLAASFMLEKQLYKIKCQVEALVSKVKAKQASK